MSGLVGCTELYYFFFSKFQAVGGTKLGYFFQNSKLWMPQACLTSGPRVSRGGGGGVDVMWQVMGLGGWDRASVMLGLWLANPAGSMAGRSAKTSSWTNAVSLPRQRLRHWPDNETAFCQPLSPRVTVVQVIPDSVAETKPSLAANSSITVSFTAANWERQSCAAPRLSLLPLSINNWYCNFYMQEITTSKSS